MVKNIVILSIIASQLIWNVSDTLVRESWATEEQAEQDFSKESSGKEKEVQLHSYFQQFLKGPSRVYISVNNTTLFYKDVFVASFKPITSVFTKVPLYLLQSRIRV